MSIKGVIYIQVENGYQKLDNWDSVLERDNFTTSLLSDGKELEKLIGEYHLEEVIHCGLPNCHRTHKRGYIAQNLSGKETNIGHICGAKYFPESINYSVITKEFSESLKAYQAKENIIMGKSLIDKWLLELDDIKGQKFGASWAYNRIEALRRNTFVGSFIVSELRNMAKSGNGKVIYSRISTPEERKKMDDNGERILSIIDEEIGTVQFLSSYLESNSLRELIVTKLEPILKLTKYSEIDNLSNKELINLSKNIDQVPSLFQEITNKLALARKFLTESNLKPVLEKYQRIENVEKTKDFAKFLADLSLDVTSYK